MNKVIRFVVNSLYSEINKSLNLKKLIEHFYFIYN